MTIAPPLDLSPRQASLQPEDFAIPTGQEVEWRFSPLAEIGPFFHAAAEYGAVEAAEETDFVRTIDISDLGSSWIPTDRASAIARAHASRAVIVDIPAESVIEEPILVRLLGSGPLAYQHVEIHAGAFSRATIIVEHDLDRDVSGAVVVTVGDNAHLTMLSIVDGSRDHIHLSAWHTTTGRDSTFIGCAVTLGGRVVRISPSVSYASPGGSAELLGVFLAEGGQYLEHRIFVEHVQPHCTSRVTYKGALSGPESHTVWVGDVLVRRDAIGTDTYEMNRNLILNEGPRADSVPNLELETGEIVGAGHASATGRFDDEQLFYLQSRGINQETARQLVVRGFFADVLGKLNEPRWRDAIMTRISARLGISIDESADE